MSIVDPVPYTINEVKETLLYWEIRFQQEGMRFALILGYERYKLVKNNLNIVAQLVHEATVSRNGRAQKLQRCKGLLQLNFQLFRSVGIVD